MSSTSNNDYTNNRTNLWIVIVGLLLGILMANFSAIFPTVDVFDYLEARSIDACFRLRGPIKPETNDVVIVTADETTNREISRQWPYSRAIWAHTVDNLNAAGAKVIAFDLLFDSPADSAGDEEFAQAVKRAGNVVLAGQIAGMNNKNNQQNDPVVILPDKRFFETGAQTGFVNVESDNNGVVRVCRTFYTIDKRNYLSLAAWSLFLYRSIPNVSDKIIVVNHNIYIGGPKIESKLDEKFLINYYGPSKTFPTYNLSQVLGDSNLVKAGNPFAGKIVLIGNSMAGNNDFKPTPFSDRNQRSTLTSGTEIQANALQTLLSGKYYHFVNPWLQIAIWTILGIVVVLIAGYRSIWVSTSVLVLMLGVVIVTGTLLFTRFQLIPYFIAPIGCIVSTFIITLLTRANRG